MIRYLPSSADVRQINLVDHADKIILNLGERNLCERKPIPFGK